jgi:hypothetical protein
MGMHGMIIISFVIFIGIIIMALVLWNLLSLFFFSGKGRMIMAESKQHQYILLFVIKLPHACRFFLAGPSYYRAQRPTSKISQ